MAWFSWKRTQKQELGQSKSDEYVPASPGTASAMVHWEDRPMFSVINAEMMLLDPKVTLGLAVRNGLVKQGEVEVEGGHPRIRDFVAHQFERIWRIAAGKLLTSKQIGFAAFEPLYQMDREKFPGKWIFSGLRDFHPRDVRPLVAEGRVVGFTLRGVNRQAGAIGPTPADAQLWEPKSLWLTYRDRYNTHFGQPLLEHAYAPWWEKWQKGGFRKLLTLRMMKDAWVGDVIRYPSKKKFTLPGGGEISHRDIAREIVELRASGGSIVLPSDKDENHDFYFDYTPPQSIEGSTSLSDWGDRLDDEILEGIEVAKEVIEAAASGSGFSGRSIPFIALCALLQEEFDEIIQQIDAQILRPLVRINFAVEPSYTIRGKSLVETISKIMGGGEQAAAGPTPGDSQNMFRMQAASRPQVGGGATATGLLAMSADLDLPARASNKDRLRPRQMRQPFGGTVGGVYYAPGEWIAADTLRFADDEELDDVRPPYRPRVWQLSDTPSGQHWITIGGRAVGDKKHVGGFPVLIDGEGKIVGGGPAAIRGDHVSNAKANFDKSRSTKKTDAKKPGKSGGHAGEVLAAINKKFESGDSVIIQTRTKAWKLDKRHAGQLKEKNGELYLQTGKTWGAVTGESLAKLSQDVGVKPPPAAEVDEAKYDQITKDQEDDARGHAEMKSVVNAKFGGSYAKFWDAAEAAGFNDSTVGEFLESQSGDVDLFGNELKKSAPKVDFGSTSGKQEQLFSKSGKPGQMNIFQDKGVPDDLISKEGREAAKSEPPKKTLVRGDADDHDFYTDRALERLRSGMSPGAVRRDMERKFAGMLDEDDVDLAVNAANQKFNDEGVPGPDGKKWPRSWKGVVGAQAEKWGVTPEFYEEMATTVWRDQAEHNADREAAKKYARQRMKLNAGNLHKLEDSGKDYSNVRGLDTLGREIASMFPAMGWGGGYTDDAGGDDRPFDELVYELVKEGKQETPSKLSPEFHAAIDGYIQDGIDRAGFSDVAKTRKDAPDADPWAAEEDDVVPFSDSDPSTFPVGFELSKFSTTQFDLPDDVAGVVLSMKSQIHPDDLASDEHAGPDFPHITIKYGLHTDDPDEVRAAFAGESPVSITLGETSVFENEDGDVVKIEVDGKQIRRLNARLSERLRHTTTHADYMPHVTIARVRSGLGEKYAAKLSALRGKSIAFDRVSFSNRYRVKTSIPLDGSTQFSDEEK